MPLFDYACQECNHRFETLVFRNESVECPECRTEKVERQLSLPARPHSSNDEMPMACNPEGPSCGAPWCQKK